MKKLILSVLVLFSITIPGFAIDMSREIDAATAKLMPDIIQ